jgi:superfamily II DNA or RNA helicase
MSEYPNLKINGRLFPTWVLANFEKYKLPEIIRKEGEDPCAIKTKLELRQYQKFISTFLDYKSPFREMLVYHGLGSGKTASAINIYNMLYNYSPGWNVFILIPASLKGTWLDELKTWLIDDEREERFSNIHFIHYDSPYADRDFLNVIKKSDSAKKSLYIFDEAHNFIKNVYSNINSKIGKRAHTIYDYIIQDKKENMTTRVILLSGTPAVNNPFELAIIYNLLRPGIFPMNENSFNELYLTTGENKMLHPDRKNMFQRRIMGLTSFYIGSTPDLYADKKLLYKNMVMSDYQADIYKHYEYIEDQLELRRSSKMSSGTVYKTYTRQACNFVFPNVSADINGETRPRPGKFRITLREAEKLQEGKDIVKKGEETAMLVTQYLDAIQSFKDALQNYWNNLRKNDEKTGNTLEQDVKIFKEKYKMKFSKFWKEYKNKSSLLESMYNCSCKMTAICFYIFRSKGPTIVFSNFVKMEGLEIFKMYLGLFGYNNISSDRQGLDHYRYAEYHGDIDFDTREQNKKLYNDITNIEGKKIKIMLISPAGSEGITLANVRQIHILEPYWNEVRIDQLIGRGIRSCSHKDLPMNERKVDVFRYHAVRKDVGMKSTTDEKIHEIAKEKKKLIGSFLDTVKEVAVDCELFKNHNKLQDGDYTCFKFDENILFDKYIGPAYKDDIYYDSKIDNGLNSINSMTKKIKAYKIKAVKKLEEDKYSTETFYWFDEESGIVYDYDLDYPIGKVKIDENGIPEKLNKDTYIISEVINIPELKRK